jgi:hypothetical protein
MKRINTLLVTITIALGLTAAAQAQDPFTNGLVAYYPFNGNANDASGNGHNGFATNTYPATNQFGQANAALGFAGNSWVHIPYSASFAATNFSVSLMFNSKLNLQDVCIVRSGAGPSPSDFYRGYELATVDFNQNFGFWAFNGLPDYGTGRCVTPVSGWQTNQWYNLTFTQIGTNALLYVNGVLVASATNTTPYAPAQSSPLFIGSNASWSSDPTATPFGFFTGIISDVRFYNRGLSSTEVQQLYFYNTGGQVDLIKAVKPSFSYLRVGTTFQLQVSADLNNWTNQGSAFTATNSSMIYPQYWDVDNWNQLFFRLQSAP